LRELISYTRLHPHKDTTAVETVRAQLAKIHRGEIGPPDAFLLYVPPLAEWREMRSTYLTRGGRASFISIFDQDEGQQQEEIAVWLTDALQPTGCFKSPQIDGPTVTRELCDVLLSHQFGAFLIESKSLSIFRRGDLPPRGKLSRDVAKHITKAYRQLSGGLRWLKLGYRVFDSSGNQIEVEREHPAHAIILVPDLTLLSESKDFGGDFVRRFYSESGAILHILDPAELLRMVQVAATIADKSRRVSSIMAFDWYLMERAKRTVTLKTPDFGMIARFPDHIEPAEGLLHEREIGSE
jgi:hypothetical protein